MNRRRLIAALALVFAVNISLIAFAQQAQAATYRQGSSGEQVRVIQTKLKNWGYYDGAVDGVFGSQTTQAVKYFQRKNGLTADGIVGPATLKALGMWEGSSSTQQASVDLLARVISAEARGELRMTEEEENLLLEKARRYGVSSLNMNYRYFHRGLWQKMADAGIAFSLWTANDEETIRRLLAYDLENLTTRMPVFACRVRAELAGNPCR